MNKTKPKIFFKPLIYGAIIMSVVAVVAGYILRNKDVEYTYEYVNGEIISHSWLDVFTVAAYVYLGIAVIMLLIAIANIIAVRKNADIPFARNIVLAVVLIPVSVAVIFFSKTLVTDIDWDYAPQYYEFNGENHNIVICERSMGLEGLGDVYQVEEDGTAYRIGGFATDGGYRNEGNYTFEWTDEGVTIHFIYDINTKTGGYVIAEWVE